MKAVSVWPFSRQNLRAIGGRIISSSARAQAIRGDRANGQPKKNAFESGDGKRFVVRADEKLTAFVELEAATGCAVVNTLLAKITMSKLRLTTER